MAFTISYVIQAVNSFTPSANQIANSVRRLRDRMLDLSRSVRRASEGMRNLGGRMTVGITAPIGFLGLAAVKAAANLETLEVGLVSMLGSAEKAKGFVKELTDFTAKTPFQLEGVASSAKLLLGFGVQSDKVLGTMQQLGDVAATVDRPIGELADIFGKVKFAGKVTQESLEMLMSRGVPIIGVLSKKFGKSEDVIRKAVSNSEITFQHFTEALETMTSKKIVDGIEQVGFAFKGMQNKSKTLAGVFSTFKDNVNIALGAVGTELVKVLDLKGSLTSFTDVIANMGAAFVRFSETNPRLAKFAILVAAGVAVLGPMIASLGFFALGASALIPIVVGLGTAIGTAITFLIPIVVGLGTAIGTAITFALGPIGLIIIAIAAVVAGIVLLVKNWDTVKEVTSNAVDFMAEKAKQGFDFIMGIIKTAGRFIAENNPFSVMVEMIGFLIKKITGFDILSFLPDKLRSFIGLDVEAPPTPAAETGLATAGGANNVTDINVNLSDREGLVDSISSSSSGNGTSPRVGRNVAP